MTGSNAAKWKVAGPAGRHCFSSRAQGRSLGRGHLNEDSHEARGRLCACGKDIPFEGMKPGMLRTASSVLHPEPQ